jgi:hypothetical protein
MRVLVIGVGALVAASFMVGCDSGESVKRVIGAQAPLGVVCSRLADTADVVASGEPTGDPTPGYKIDPPLSCHGDRNAVIQLGDLIPYDHLHVAVTAYSGDDYFIAEAYCADGFSHALAHIDGHPYTGNALVEHAPFLGERLHTPQYIHVQARGPWTITIVDVATMPKLNAGTTRGHGDAVLVVPPALSDGPASYTFTHSGKSNFIVVPADGGLYHAAALINIIGPYTGEKTVPGGTEIIGILADGDWTIKRNS